MSEQQPIEVASLPSNFRQYLQTNGEPLMFYEYFRGRPGGFFALELSVKDKGESVYNSAYVTYDFPKQGPNGIHEQVFHPNALQVGLILGTELPHDNYDIMTDALYEEFLPEDHDYDDEYADSVEAGIQSILEAMYIGMPTLMLNDPNMIQIVSGFSEHALVITDDGAYMGDTPVDVGFGRENLIRLPLIIADQDGNYEEDDDEWDEPLIDDGYGEEEDDYAVFPLYFRITINCANTAELQTRLKELVQSKRLTQETLREIINIEWVIIDEEDDDDDEDESGWESDLLAF